MCHAPERGFLGPSAYACLLCLVDVLFFFRILSATRSGMYLEGARWDMTSNSLEDSKPKEMFTGMPVITCKAGVPAATIGCLSCLTQKKSGDLEPEICLGRSSKLPVAAAQSPCLLRTGEREGGQEHLHMPYLLRAHSPAVLRVRCTASDQGTTSALCVGPSFVIVIVIIIIIIFLLW